jgi:BirA family biotin operon repressor/biotin-[acetyl-CoA-carboxylase] ligase
VERALLSALSGLNFGTALNYDIYRFGKIDSTNSYLLELGDKGFPEGTVAVADEQTSGRGRFARRWEAEPLSSLLFSILLRPVFLNRDEVFILTFSASVAVAEAIENVTDVKTELKWPNDVLIRGRKVCGILLESDFEGEKLNYVVIGIGLNVNQVVLPDEIKTKAVSLSMAAGRSFDREELLSSILLRFNEVYESLKERDFYSIMKRWRDKCLMFGKRINFNVAGKEIEGVLEEVTDDGAVSVRTSSGVLKFTAGEMTISEFNRPGAGGII